jgi:ribosomal protein S18 acetylase RimI-like enzyme
MEIKRAFELDNNVREKISEIFVEAFYEHFRYFSKDTTKLIKTFSHMFVLEYIYVAVIDNEIAGMIACMNKEQFCINHNKKILMNNFGLVKGFFASIVFKNYFNKYPKYPIEMDEKTASVEFAAINKNFRKNGIATKIMEYLLSFPEYKHYIVEVADTNINSLGLCKKMGFKEVYRKKMKIGKKRSGINYLVYLKYSKE